jgi:asparagine synthase (glutamine-hydrolysing)
MSDFLIQFRGPQAPGFARAASFFKYFDDVRIFNHSTDAFSMVVARSDDASLWGPFTVPDGSATVALGGRVAFDEREWEAARGVDGPGGLACKAIYKRYAEGGLRALEELNGNFVVLLHDEGRNQVHLVTDRCGMCMCFAADTGDQGLVYGSHPDAVADAADVSTDWDLVSLAEFLMAGRLSFPHTYHRRVRAVPYGAVLTVNLGDSPPSVATRPYFQFNYRIDDPSGDWEMAEQLAAAFTKAVTRRTYPFLGGSALALSGGLDSRSLLCCVPDKTELITFCCYDNENPEFLTARAIARAAGARFVPIQRTPDYYGDAADMGVRISGGMGNLANNHFLGIRDRLRELGVQNLLTGCYCDYLLKGLVMDKSVSRLTKRERPAPFRDEHYHEYCRFTTEFAREAEERERGVIPESLRSDDSERAATEVEHRRTFPLYYEADCLQRVIPQRVMGWYLPVVDGDILDVRLRLSRSQKLNRSVFQKMVTILCGKGVGGIPDVNTGVPVDAYMPAAVAARLVRVVRRKWQRKMPSLYSDGSWPNWAYYLYHSRALQGIWNRANPMAEEVFTRIMGADAFKRNLHDYHRGDRDLGLAMRLLTLKSWLDQRAQAGRMQ